MDGSKKELGIYVHIPFCVRKCNYCDFLSSNYCNEDIEQQKLVNDYIDALVKEITLYSKDLSNYKVHTIYIGGGTPSSIDSEYIRIILDSIYEKYDICDNPEITIEVNPGTLLNTKICDYKKMGINRVSMGLQSANNSELKILGRIHTYEEFVYSYDALRNADFDNINIDVMSAIPNQSLSSYIETLNKVVELKPEHISSYSLIIEEGTYFYQRQNELNLVCEDEEREMYYKTKEILRASGYNRYEISNYSLKGMESKHNSSYWTGKEYIGFGLGASSYIGGCRFDRIRDIHKFIETYNKLNNEKGIEYNKIKECVKRKIECNISRLSEKDMIEEYMFLGLRMTRGISIYRFKELFNKDIFDLYGEVIDKNMDRGLINHDKEFIFLTDLGIDVSNMVLSEFLI